MKNKSLIVIIIVLTVILAVGVALIFALGNPSGNPSTQPPQQDLPEQQVTEDVVPEQTGDEVTVPGADVQEPTENAEADVTEPAQETEPAQTEAPTEPPAPNLPTEPDTEVPSTKVMDYEWYHSLSGAEQAAFINTFENYDAFFAWYNAAQREYENAMTEIDGTGPIEIGG